MKKGLYKILSILVTIAILVTTFPFGAIVSAVNGSDGFTVVDNSTHHHWHEDIENSTKEIGRIWTDKTVWDVDTVFPYEHQMPGQLGVNKGSSDLLIELSAISSAASITGKVTTTLPLDIVVVMDTSGSMADPMPSGEYDVLADAGESVSYSDVYSSDNNSRGGLYFKIGDNYVPITVSRSGSMLNRRYTIYYTAPGSTTPTYIVNNGRDEDFVLNYDICTLRYTTRLAALKASVNNFIDQTKAANDLIENQAEKHRISLVRFASSSQTLIGLTYVDSSTNVQTLKTSVSGLNATGATRADYGMDSAESILIGNNNSARASAQKVVIFFTDGTPTTQSSFSASVANSAVSSAKALKDQNTLIYTIGVYEEADPTDTSRNFNQYMHGMSNNYPGATSYTNLGNRADGSNYYLTATDAGALDNVFSGILEDVTSLKASASTQVEEGNEGASGYITFVDPLGKYMQVDDFKAISFAENNYTNPAITVNGNVTTYTFEGENSQNPIYPTTGNLNQIIITVEKSSNLLVGDIVTVKIPGALIPIHHYAVDIDENGNITMIEDTTLPMRIWYGVSVKDGVKAALENPDAELTAYINANKDANGNVMFYSNLYVEGETSVYSTFEPNQKNNFYFFQNDEYLFTDAACTQPATSLDINTTYYYQRDYYHPVSNPSFALEAEKLVNTTTIPSSSNTLLTGYAKIGANGQYYIPKGAPRTTSITGYSVAKADVFAGATNVTGTSENAIKPSWINVEANPTTVKNELGNNGIVKLTVPGTLAIKKVVTADEGLTAPDKDFTIKVELTAPAGDTLKEAYNAQVYDANGNAVGSAFEFKPATADSVVLKADQTVYIYGLAAGTSFSVSEPNSSMPAGFIKTGAAYDQGAISSGSISAITITNNYSVSHLSFTGTELGLTGTKVLDGRQFKDGDVFEFMVAATVFSPDAPLPSGVTNGKVTVTANSGTEKNFDLGTFTFTKPGEYHYEIREIIPSENKIVGVSYDSTIYRIVITIADNGEGQLVLDYLEIDKNDPVTAAWTSLYEGDSLPNANANYPEFTNTYSVDTESIVIRGTKTLEGKNLVDYSGNPFKFVISAAGSRTVGSTGNFAVDAAQPMPSATTVIATTTGDIVFPNIEFDGTSVGKEYKYIITEYQPTEDGTYNGTRLNGVTVYEDFSLVYKGVTYDKSEKEVIIKVTSVDGGGVEIIAPEVTGNQFSFVNKYNSNPATYEILGEKNLNGRDFKDGDTFKFEITPVDNAPTPIDSVNYDPVTSVTINPNADNKAEFSFGTVWFNHEDVFSGQTVQGSSARIKTFTYKLREIALGANGIVYDTAERTLTIDVRDLDGETEITSVKLDGVELGNNRVVWNNEYNASVNYSGINVIKTLMGKALLKDEFSFKISAEAGTPAPSADNALFSIPFDVYYNAAGDFSSVIMNKLTGITFDQDDAGKTFSFIAEEVVPQTTGRTVYDKSTYRIELKPYDNGDGTMGVKTVITQLTNSNGQANVGSPYEFDSANGDVPSVRFINHYDPVDGVLNGGANLEIVKSFIGRDWTQNDAFEFELELEGNVPQGAVIMPAETTLVINKDTADYAKAFGDIYFTQVGTYTFSIKEKTPLGNKKDGVTYDSNVSKITVDVVNRGSGALEVIVNSADTLTFVNVYEVGTGANVIISGEKTLNGKNLVDGDFTFELYSADENFVIGSNPIDTVTNISGEFEFSIDYDPTNVGNTFYYVLKERNAGETIDGVYYDASEYRITVEVKDDGVGGAMAIKTVKKNGSDVSKIEFINEYAVREGASVEISGTKDLSGRDMADDEFTFELYGADSEFVVSGAPLTATNKSGEIEFILDYEASDAGTTYYYVLKEKNAGLAVDGVQFDDTEYHITVELNDDGNGGMTAVKTVKKGDQTVNVVEFKNQYSTTSAKATISGGKLLEGRELEADEFTFKLFASNSACEYDKNNALQSVKNAKDGKFSFEELSFDAVGIYYYVVAEDTSVDAEGITFDESIYLVKIEVKDNGKGALVADDLVITKKGSVESVEEITFKNVFTSKPSVPESPKTGDNSNVWLWFILILASGFVIIITGYELKRTSVSTEE